MAPHARDWAIYVAGIATTETVGHWWLGIWGTDLLPLKVGPWTVTPDANAWFMAAWPVVLLGAAWFALTRREQGSVPEPRRLSAGTQS